jgi:hypothetical protein
MMASAPSIPNPLARLSPIDCITIAATMDARIRACRKSTGVKTFLVVFSKVNAISEDNRKESNTVNRVVIKVGFSELPCNVK